MIDRSSTSLPRLGPRRNLAIVVLGFVLILFLLSAGPGLTGAVNPSAANQCVACHTDAAKLKALTPPDPPVPEEGEG